MKMIIKTICFSIAFFLVLLSFQAFSQKVEWSGLTVGKYKVGFKTIRQNNKHGNPMLMGIWYPAVNETMKMSIADYIKRGRVDEKMRDSVLLNQFREIIGIEWVFNLKIPSDDFNNSINQLTNTSQDAPMAKGKFPLVIAFAQPIDYAGSFEFLASHGFVVATVSAIFPDDKLSDDSPQFFVKYTDLLEELLESMTIKPYIKQNDISVLGHGFGIQPAMYLAMRNAKIKKVVNLDGGFFGPRSKSTISVDYQPQNLKMPLLHIITENQLKQDDKIQFETLKNPITRIIIKPTDFKHHDFTSFGRFVTNSVKMRGDKTEIVNKTFEGVHRIMLSFLLNEKRIMADTVLFDVQKFNEK